MKQFKLTLMWCEPESFKYKQVDTIEADDLIELLTKFNIVLINLQRIIHKEELLELRMKDDDIPF